MVRILDKAAVQPLNRFNPARSFTIRRSPQKSGINTDSSELSLSFSNRALHRTNVEPSPLV